MLIATTAPVATIRTTGNSTSRPKRSRIWAASGKGRVAKSGGCCIFRVRWSWRRRWVAQAALLSLLSRQDGSSSCLQTITTSPNPKVHKQHLRELLFMRDCTHPNIVQYYGAYLEAVRLTLACFSLRNRWWLTAALRSLEQHRDWHLYGVLRGG